jgi:hypothetical protein
MDFEALVQAVRLRSGARSEDFGTTAGATGINQEMVMWVQDAWRDLQMESRNWWFRQKLDQTLAISASDDEYDMPAGLETLNYRTVSIYTTAKEDENVLSFVPYEEWRMYKDTVDSGEGRPTMIVERPDGVLQLWPVPDEDYTLRFDGVWGIDEMTADTDEPGTTITSGTRLLPVRYEYTIVWDAVRRYAMSESDPETLERAQQHFRAERARLSERQTPPPRVAIGRLTGARGNRVSTWGRF